MDDLLKDIATARALQGDDAPQEYSRGMAELLADIYTGRGVLNDAYEGKIWIFEILTGKKLV